MKRKQILWTVIFSLSLVCCGLCVRYSDKQTIHSSKERLDRAKHLKESYEEQLKQLLEETELLETHLDQLAEERDQLTVKLEESNEKYFTLIDKRSRMIEDLNLYPPDEDLIEMVCSGKTYLTKENVRLQKIADDKSSDMEELYTGITASYDIVKPLGSVVDEKWDLSMDERKWVLVHVQRLGESTNSVGWMQYTDFMDVDENEE